MSQLSLTECFNKNSNENSEERSDKYRVKTQSAWSETLKMLNNICDQLGTFLAKCPDNLYVQTPPVKGTGTLGAHMRHVLDHLDAFSGGVSGSEIDYDLRKRDKETEFDRKIAIHRLSQNRSLFEKLNTGAIDTSNTVRIRSLSSDLSSNNYFYLNSTLEREFLFLIGHTIHHMALMKVLCELFEHDIHENFGKAYSTLQNEMAPQT